MKNYSKELQAGVFVAAGLIVFVVAIWLLGSENHLFSQKQIYYAQFSDVKGLSVGAPVRLGGITIGRVDNVEFTRKEDTTQVLVKFAVKDSYTKEIRTDSVVSLETQGLLGDQLVSISSGIEKDLIKPGSEINTSETGNMSKMMEKAGAIVDNTAEVSKKINAFLAELNPQAIEGIGDGFASLGSTLKDIKSTKGLVNQLIYSEDKANSILGNINSFTKDISDLSSEVKKGKGLLHAFVYGKDGEATLKEISKASEKLAETAQGIAELSKEIASGDGLIHSLIYQTPDTSLEEILKKLNQTADNFKKASEALSQGEGTLGALLIDSSLYDNLVEVTDDAKRSFLLKQAIKSSLKTGK